MSAWSSASFSETGPSSGDASRPGTEARLERIYRLQGQRTDVPGTQALPDARRWCVHLMPRCGNYGGALAAKTAARVE